MSIRHFVVTDLEATCTDSGAFPRNEMEIIEIGAVAVDAQRLEPVEEFQCFVRPILHPELTDFCRQLTGITQADIDAAETFAHAWPRFATWLESLAPFRFASWGAYDRNQIRQDCRLHRLPPPTWPHLNLKQQFSVRQNTRRRFGMAAALRRVGLPLDGKHHRGIDDARNIAKLLPHCLG